MKSLTTQDLAETDLVTISEREVIQRAKIWTEAQANPYATANLVRLKAEELTAAVSLLESREQIRDQIGEKNEGK